MFSVEVIPDAATEAAIVGQWERLIEAGLPSAGRHPSPSNRPHVTLAVRDDLDPSGLGGLVDALPVEFRLGGAVVFAAGDRFVLARQVVVSRALLALHAETLRLVGPPPERYAVTAADRWTPHLTIARRMTGEQMGAALSLIGAAPLEGTFRGLRVWDAVERVVTTLR